MLVLACGFIVSNVEAVEIYNSVLNLTINLSDQYYDSIDTNSAGFIQFTGLRASESTGNKVTINLTERNKTYQGSQLPYFSTVNDNQLIITSDILQNLSSSITYIAHSCTDVTKLSYTSASGTQVLNYSINQARMSCSGGVVTINNVTLEQGDNIFYVHGIEEQFFMFGMAIEFILAILPIITIVLIYIIIKFMLNTKINAGTALFMIVMLLVMVYVISLILNSLLGLE